MRRNHGFHLVATGPDLIVGGPPGGFQTVRLCRRGGMTRLTVDGVVAVAFDDDGLTHGPVWLHPGWIGLRQMGHTVRRRCDNLRVHSLRDNPETTP